MKLEKKWLISLPSPKSINFQNPEDWPKWKSWFEQFPSSLNLDQVDQTRQIDTHQYCMGEESEEVLTSRIAEEDQEGEQQQQETYDSVIEKFEKFCV